MQEMDPERINSVANAALVRLRSELPDDKLLTELYPVMIMNDASKAINHGETGVRALKGLLNLWHQLGLTEVSEDSIQTLCAAVKTIYIESRKRTNKGSDGARL